MRLFINGNKVLEGNLDRLDIRMELDGDETIGPCNLRIEGGTLTVQGTSTETAIEITYPEGLIIDSGVILNTGPPYIPEHGFSENDIGPWVNAKDLLDNHPEEELPEPEYRQG